MISENIQIEIIPSLEDNYIYLIKNKSENITSVIDPSDANDVEKLLSSLNWKLDEIINTHHHLDHTGGNSFLKSTWNAKIIAPKYEKDKISNIDIEIKDGDTILLAGLKTHVIHTPGHTIGHVIYYIPSIPLIFSGDTLFVFGCGRIFEGTFKNMWESLNKIMQLKSNSMIFCGHEYTKTNLKFALSLEKDNEFLIQKYDFIKKYNRSPYLSVPSILSDELKGNPFLRFNDDNLKKRLGLKNKSSEDFFAELRKMKDSF